MFTALIIAGAFIKIPTPFVAITLQFLFTTLAGFLLGGRLGLVSVLIYLVMGLIGIPVFTQGGGFSYVLQPSFGYLIGFALGTYVTGIIANKGHEPGFLRLLAAGSVGLLLVYLCGMIYYELVSTLYLGNPIGFRTLFIYYFLIFIPGDLVSCIVAALIGKRLIPLLKRIRTHSQE